MVNSDINTNEGTKIDAVTSSCGLQQLISQPTHLLANSFSCIDLNSTDHPSLIVDCGNHPSLHPNCQHQIIYGKLDLKIIYPPPHQKYVWDFKRSNVNSIKKNDSNFMLMNKTVPKQVATFKTIFMNIFSN